MMTEGKWLYIVLLFMCKDLLYTAQLVKIEVCSQSVVKVVVKVV